MDPYLYLYFHEKTNDRTEGGLVNIPVDTKKWPKDWTSSDYKTYPRLDKIFPDNQAVNSNFTNLLSKRSSSSSKISSQTITLTDLFFLLESGYGLPNKTNMKQHTVPSGGGRYPLELYVSIWGSVPGLSSGQYHYCAHESALTKLPSRVVTKTDVAAFTPYSWVKDCHGVIIISAVMGRSIRKYGSRGYRYILLEAGHVGQNIALAATERNLSVRPMGGITETFFEDLLELDLSSERVVYAIVF